MMGAVVGWDDLVKTRKIAKNAGRPHPAHANHLVNAVPTEFTPELVTPFVMT